MFKPNHLHILIKGTFENPPLDTTTLNNFFQKLVNKVRMKVVAGPTSVMVDEPGNEGVTGTVTLATSHSSMHVWEKMEPAMFQFDLYSCSEFNTDEVLSILNHEFSLLSYEYWMIDRNGKFKMIESGNYD
jgi:S-adenosylmethionine/arginine decarboxylase-like enzyme